MSTNLLEVELLAMVIDNDDVRMCGIISKRAFYIYYGNSGFCEVVRNMTIPKVIVRNWT